eukprot:scaffold100775_cov72-Cyclotella_meneghiniana.AAC.4
MKSLAVVLWFSLPCHRTGRVLRSPLCSYGVRLIVNNPIDTRLSRMASSLLKSVSCSLRWLSASLVIIGGAWACPAQMKLQTDLVENES